MKASSNAVTYCVGYWHIPENRKRSLEHYLTTFAATLKMLENQPIALFYEDEGLLRYVKKHRQGRPTKAYRMRLKSLPTFKLSKDYLLSCVAQDNDRLRGMSEPSLEKGLVHYSREFQSGGKDAYRKMFTVWTSKLYLVKKAILENPFQTDYFAWCDASLSRFNERRDNWRFPDTTPSPERILHYGNDMLYHGNRIRINASFILGHQKMFLSLIRDYSRQLRASKRSGYAHDEETILNLIYSEDRFRCLNPEPTSSR